MVRGSRVALRGWVRRALLRWQVRGAAHPVRMPPPPPRPVRPLEDVARDLSRLGVLMSVADLSDGPERAERMRGVSLAYDRMLVAACRSLELPVPRAPMAAIDRLETEASLALRGLDW